MAEFAKDDIDEFLNPVLLRGDLAAARRVLGRHPQLTADPTKAAFLMHHLAMLGSTAGVALLHEFGVDVNVPKHPEMPDRPLGRAVSAGQVETVRWLLGHGSDVNYGWGGEAPHCHPLPIAIKDDRLDIVQLLVEAGADLAARDRNGQLPLDWAVAFGRAAIADYLRAKGARLTREQPGYVAPPPEPELPPVARYAAEVLGWAARVPWAPVVPDGGPVEVYYFANGDEQYLFTAGMSDRPMSVPPGGEGYRHAELVVGVPPGWWPAGGDWSADRCRWVLQWLRQLAQLPFDTGEWLGGQWGVVSNGDPPEPLSAYTPMTGWLLLAAKGPLTRLELDDGRAVVFYTAMPVHTAEADLALSDGVVALLERFAAAGVGDDLAPDRPSVV